MLDQFDGLRVRSTVTIDAAETYKLYVDAYGVSLAPKDYRF